MRSAEPSRSEAVVIRASLHFRRDDQPTEGWLCDLDMLPRIGDEIRLLDSVGADLQYGTVAATVHTLIGTTTDSRAGAQMVEVYVDV